MSPPQLVHFTSKNGILFLLSIVIFPEDDKNKTLRMLNVLGYTRFGLS
jgi:hypothetical protein